MGVEQLIKKRSRSRVREMARREFNAVLGRELTTDVCVVAAAGLCLHWKGKETRIATRRGSQSKEDKIAVRYRLSLISVQTDAALLEFVACAVFESGGTVEPGRNGMVRHFRS